jgi:hypothetical protein
VENDEPEHDREEGGTEQERAVPPDVPPPPEVAEGGAEQPAREGGAGNRDQEIAQRTAR